MLVRSEATDTCVLVCFCRMSTTPFQTLSDTSPVSRTLFDTSVFARLRDSGSD
jgi:hypothetical protein